MKATAPLIAAALIAGTALAAAQTTPPANDSKAAEPPPTAIQNAPPDKIAPATKLKERAEPKAGEKKALETIGAAPDKAPAKPNLTAPPKPGETADPADQPSDRNRDKDLEGPKR